MLDVGVVAMPVVGAGADEVLPQPVSAHAAAHTHLSSLMPIFDV
jgi:hypothetical protein